MRIIYLAVVVGFIVTVIAGLGYAASKDEETQRRFILGEIFKATLAFTLVAAAGGVIKNVGERVLEVERSQRSRSERSEERRQQIINEFGLIFSDFYSIRKLWHSAISKRNDIFREDEKKFQALRRELLEKSVDLEGRYGALKHSAISHFGLRSGDFGTKSVPDLEKEVAESEDIRETARLQLDLLGELYDDWRHALEDSRKIELQDAVWSTYESLLDYFEYSEEESKALSPSFSCDLPKPS